VSVASPFSPRDLARTRRDQGRADQHRALAVADQLERAVVSEANPVPSNVRERFYSVRKAAALTRLCRDGKQRLVASSIWRRGPLDEVRPGWQGRGWA
jgi:hypothetical protein